VDPAGVIDLAGAADPAGFVALGESDTDLVNIGNPAGTAERASVVGSVGLAGLALVINQRINFRFKVSPYHSLAAFAPLRRLYGNEICHNNPQCVNVLSGPKSILFVDFGEMSVSKLK
jgi:hypothetical protein